VLRTPDVIALVFDQQSLTYAQLNAQANRLAHHLMSQGIGPDDRVAVCMERSIAMVVGLLAILKAGGAYVPLDPAYPSERLHDVLRDAAPALLLTDAIGRTALGSAAQDVPDAFDLIDDAPRWARASHDNPSVAALASHHLAYIIHTSGSTGTPKGVMVEHRNMANHLAWQIEQFQFSAQDVFLQRTSYAFDASGWEIWTPLAIGAPLVLLPTAAQRDARSILETVTTQHVSVMQAVPSLLPAMADAADGRYRLRYLFCGGEPLHAESLRQAQSLARAGVVNLYGPTEATIDATAWICPPGFEGAAIPVGRPIANTQIYLLDAHGQPVPLGAVGEMYIGGGGVARGYLNRQDLTAERFLPDPFSPHPQARMYRTGDLARYLPDGNLIFLGRNDHQVKIRGFRIEPGEIEARLLEHATIREAVVIAREDVPGDKRLVAYVTTADDVTVPFEPLALRQHLHARLPDYMVPAAFVCLHTLPLTPNGKLDRKALPAPDGEAFARDAYEPPQGELEQTLATMWGELLGIARVGRADNFFALGGHSLLAVRLLARLTHVLHLQLPLTMLFNHPTLQTLASAVAAAAAKTSPLSRIEPIVHGGPLPLSFAQQRLWFLAQLDGVSSTYHIPMAVHLRGSLDVEVWQRSLNTLFARHEALRSVFVADNGAPYVQLLSPDHGLPLLKHDLHDVADASSRLAQLTAEEMHAPFDLTCGPLIRARLIRLTEDAHVFLLTQHHIISDGWSIGVLVRELNALYRAFLHGQADPLPALAIQYPDYAFWQRQRLTGERQQRYAEYWKRTLAQAPSLLSLPTDRPRPVQQSFVGATMPITLDATLTAELRHLCQQHECTLFVVLLAAWSVVLARLSCQDDLVIGTPSANRTHPDIESMVGFFVNTLALRIDLSREPSGAELLARVRSVALAALDHQDLPFEQVLEIVQPPRRPDHTPLFQVMFAWQNNESGSFELPGMQVESLDQDYDLVKFDLELNLGERDGVVVGALCYSSALFDAATIAGHRDYLIATLQALVSDTARAVHRIDMLSQDERTRLLTTWNRTEVAYPADHCIHHLFEQQVRRAPDAVAIVHDTQSLTYAQLDAQANQLAHHLIRQGVRPGAFVAILFERGIALVVAQLAILKAGAAYVPLDTRAPETRQAWMIDDCAAVAVIAPESSAMSLAAGRLLIRMSDASNESVHAPELSIARCGEDPAYVMYTSGSTGLPKGVIVPHRGVRRLVIRNGYADFDASDRIAFAANPAFDASTMEVWGALANGGCIVTIDTDTLVHAERFAQAMLQYNVTAMFLTTTMFNQYSRVIASTLARLKYLMCGGERNDPEAFWRILDEGGPQQLIHCYGPTESTTFALTCVISLDYRQSTNLPIGRPIANTRAYVLDVYRQPTPLGAVGELYIGGDGVACGYLNRPELTAERFLPDPFSSTPGASMYRTGDLVRYMPDGRIEFHGRNDHQVKIRGFRIEPGEVEAYLVKHPHVHEAAVLMREDSAGDKRLVAYVIPAQGLHLETDAIVAALRTYVSEHLPDYLAPAAFVCMDNWPVNANGKLDRKALPAPDSEAYARRTYEAPQGEVELILAQVWKDLLKIDNISRHDNFFELGGHSMLMVLLLSQLRRKLPRKLRTDLPIARILYCPTLQEQARALETMMA
jgi:amino acid adenylation domain-containing protein